MKSLTCAQQPGTLWWVLGMDTDNHWHERRIVAASLDQVNAWWVERANRLPDIAWSALEAIDKINTGLARLGQWPSLDDASKPHWFLGWVGHASADDEMASLVAVPAKDANHAALILQHEKPGSVVRILGDAATLIEVVADLEKAIAGNTSLIDEDLTPKPAAHLSKDASAWLAKQFDMDTAS